MPTKRHRRTRVQAYTPVVQALLDGRPIECTAEARAELEEILQHPFRDYPELPFLCSFARAELEGWEELETH